jgi:hypothetical protein
VIFSEANTVEQMILDAATKPASGRVSVVREPGPDWGDSLGHELRPARWIINQSENS